jgi:hypothetical protein
MSRMTHGSNELAGAGFMRMIKGMLAAAFALALAACGGGGCDAGSSPLTGAAACSASEAASGNTGTTPPSGGSTAGGGISNVSSGQPNQRSMSLSVEKYALNWGLDGDTTTVTVRVADTAGNPVPDGTAVQLSSSGGQVQTSCRLTGVASGASTISQCSVTFATQNQRPLNGFVAISAWLEGDEAYIDRNGDGKYTPGEPFYDTGRLFRDDDINGIYTPNVDELNLGSTVISSPGLGTSSCGPNAGTSGLAVTDATFGFRDNSVPTSVTGTCNGAWGRTLVRASTYLPVSDPRFLAIDQAPGGVIVSSQWSSDPANASAAPAGTTVSVVSAPAGCTFNISPPTVPNNSIMPTFHRLTPSVSGTCNAGQVTVKAAFGDNEVTVTATLPL